MTAAVAAVLCATEAQCRAECGVHALQVSRANAAPPASAMCMVGQDILFLGSWVGDSLLVQAIPEDQACLFTPTCLQWLPCLHC